MKKLVVLLFAAILSFASLFALTGCSNNDTYVQEGSFDYNLKMGSFNSYIDVECSFIVIDNTGDLNEVYYTLKGYDKDGNELWSISRSRSNLKPEGNTITISVTATVFDESSTAPISTTVSVELTNVKFEKEKDNEWMGWTFGFVSLVFTVGIIAIFVISIVKNHKEKNITEQNPKQNLEKNE